ncbi:hypothetical protein FACS1894140_2500 [Spirochaetia bacterium]|nr:hypothetical protein FACS1894140_2500 [Spirochaetia bacterium]
MKPGKTTFIAALAWLLLGAGAFFSQPLFLIWFLSGISLLPFVIFDALFLKFLTCRLNALREMPLTLAQGEPVRVRITLKKENRRNSFLPAAILFFDLYPPSMTPESFPSESGPEGRMDCESFPVSLNPTLLKNGALVFTYTLIPHERGLWNFPGMEFLFTSPLRFWQLKIFCDCPSRGRTFPDFKKLSAGTALRGSTEQRGFREIRQRGQGMEFRNLRDYQEGDSVRFIDWRATSRRRRLDGAPGVPMAMQKFIVREYQEEQDQQILFILDTGYRLPGPQFDSALNGVLLLAYTALKHGDAAAALSFGTTERWVPPRKGMSAFPILMNRLYDLRSSPVPSSPFSALENALSRLHRRSFIILISNFREEDGESLSWILPRIKQRHLLLLVSFREKEAETLAHRPSVPEAPANFSAAETLETAAAFSYLASRKRLYQSWEHLGLLTLETSPENFSSALINRYLEVKKSGRL